MAKKKQPPPLPPLAELVGNEDLSGLSFTEFLLHLFGREDGLSVDSNEALTAYQSALAALCKSDADKALLEDAVGRAIEVAIKAGRTPLAEMHSKTFMHLAKKRHSETDGMKEDVFAWLKKNDHKYTSAWSAAKAIKAENLVKLNHKTLLGYVQQFRSRQD